MGRELISSDKGTGRTWSDGPTGLTATGTMVYGLPFKSVTNGAATVAEAVKTAALTSSFRLILGQIDNVCLGLVFRK
ncbi:MAG: hypothetical protein CMJ46_15470 [Planctomyces sp.]|nr:hypothetical protein [Planctomyces sp.]